MVWQIFLFAVRQKGECMITRILTQEDKQIPVPKEGDLYKEVNIFGKTFRLLYGYYESFERDSPFNDPIPIYPDLIKNPHFTADGIPIVTAMQNICEFYPGPDDEDSCCSHCPHFQKGEDLFGLCNRPKKQ